MKRSDDQRNDEIAETRPAGDSWSRADFESALPLYVGGDLDPADAAFVDAWIARHPEDGELLARARAAYDVLDDHGRSARALAVPDLWPAIREELARTGAFTTGAPLQTDTPDRSIPAVADTGQRELHAGTVLGGPSWFRRRAVAAAAAVLLTATVGFLFVETGGTGVVENGANVATETNAPTFQGAPAQAQLVKDAPGVRRRPGAVRIHVPKATPLRPVGPAATHLMDLADERSRMPLWQRPHELRSIESTERGDARPPSNGLAGDRR